MSASDIAKSQPSILAASPPVGRSVAFRLQPDSDFKSALVRFRETWQLEAGVVGLGEPAVRAFGKEVPGLSTFPGLSGPAFAVPSTQQALWVFLRGKERGTLFDATENVRASLGSSFELHDVMDTFVYAGGR